MTKNLTFNGKTVGIEAMTTSFKSMPVIQLTRTQASDAQLFEAAAPEFRSTSQVAIYMHEGRYVVLSGHDKVKEFLVNEKATSLKAGLISKQLLKHMVTMSVPLQWQNSQAARVERLMEDQRREEDQRAAEAYQPPMQRGYGQRPQGGSRGFDDRRPSRRA